MSQSGKEKLNEEICDLKKIIQNSLKEKVALNTCLVSEGVFSIKKDLDTIRKS